MNKENSDLSISVTSLEDDEKEKDIPTSLSSSIGASLNSRKSAERRSTSLAASMTSVRKSVAAEALSAMISDPLRREHHDQKVVGLGRSALKQSLRQSSNDPSDVLDQLEGSEYRVSARIYLWKMMRSMLVQKQRVVHLCWHFWDITRP